MTDPSSQDVRNSILHLLSVPIDSIVEQLTAEELITVADRFQELADSIRIRFQRSVSPLKSSSNRILGPKRSQIESCLSKLRRFLTLVAVETNPPNEAFLYGEFKLIRNVDGSNVPHDAFSSINLEISEQVVGESPRRVFRSSMLDHGTWIPLWELNLLLLNPNGSLVDLDVSSSSMSIDAVLALRSRANTSEYSANVFILATSVLMIDILQKAQGIQLSPAPFEELMATLLDETNWSSLIPLPEPSARKRMASDMDTDIDASCTNPKRFFYG